MDILEHPNPSLKQHAQDVDPTSEPGLRDLCKRMAKVMYEAPGIGLAATQVGVMKRVIVYDWDERLIALCNPQIVEFGGETAVEEEGCLSLPGITVPVARATQVVCEALSLEGQRVRIEAEDLYARLLQHEVDHLNGMLTIDRASDEDRKEALRRYLEIQRGAAPHRKSDL